jgi:hypothetical protein
VHQAALDIHHLAGIGKKLGQCGDGTFDFASAQA